jgi:hypothetical protein
MTQKSGTTQTIWPRYELSLAATVLCGRLVCSSSCKLTWPLPCLCCVSRWHRHTLATMLACSQRFTPVTICRLASGTGQSSHARSSLSGWVLVLSTYNSLAGASTHANPHIHPGRGVAARPTQPHLHHTASPHECCQAEGCWLSSRPQHTRRWAKQAAWAPHTTPSPPACLGPAGACQHKQSLQQQLAAGATCWTAAAGCT